MGFLSGNMLKVIAAITMFIDHAGLMLFPGSAWMRLVGRLSLPIYAYMIAEGCKFTRNRVRYFGTVFALAAICQIVYFIFDGSLYLSILMTFCTAILVIYALDALKAAPGPGRALGFAAVLAAVWVLNQVFRFDYGFWGCMVPVFASLPSGTKYDRLPVRLACLGAGLACLAISIGGNQVFSLLALPILLCYSGRRGKWNMKYFFYIFYPAHLAVLQGLLMLTGR